MKRKGTTGKGGSWIFFVYFTFQRFLRSAGLRDGILYPGVGVAPWRRVKGDFVPPGQPRDLLLPISGGGGGPLKMPLESPSIPPGHSEIM